MPRVSRRSKRRTAGYTDQHIQQLLTGVTLSCMSGFGAIHKGIGDEGGMRAAWNELRDQLMPQWIAEHPGTRPYAWWKFDLPERRRRTDGVIHPFDDPVRNTEVELRAAQHPQFREFAFDLFYGKPRCLFTQDDFGATYEGELAYLDRLNLLTPEERKELFE
jgi:hypothetical protein